MPPPAFLRQEESGINAAESTGGLRRILFKDDNVIDSDCSFALVWACESLNAPVLGDGPCSLRVCCDHFCCLVNCPWTAMFTSWLRNLILISEIFKQFVQSWPDCLHCGITLSLAGQTDDRDIAWTSVVIRTLHFVANVDLRSKTGQLVNKEILNHFCTLLKTYTWEIAETHWLMGGIQPFKLLL